MLQMNVCVCTCAKTFMNWILCACIRDRSPLNQALWNGEFEATHNVPDSKVHGFNMGPTWVLPVPGGPHVGPINLAIRGGCGPHCSLSHERSSAALRLATAYWMTLQSRDRSSYRTTSGRRRIALTNQIWGLSTASDQRLTALEIVREKDN